MIFGPPYKEADRRNPGGGIMEFNRNELHILKYLTFYKLVSIGCMILSSINIVYGLYFFFWHAKSYVALSNALIGASIVVLGMGYLMYCFSKIIEKFKHRWVKEGQAGGE